MVKRFRLSAAVMHAPWDDWRAQNVEMLPVLIPPLKVVADYDHEGCWPTARRAWQAYDRLATHHLVLQDDAIPCPGFWPGLHKAVAAMQNTCINLFGMRPAYYSVATRYASPWVQTRLVLGVAVVLPVWVIPRFLRWADECVRPDYPHDDVRLRAYCQMHRLPVMQTIPSLVQHGRPEQSLVGAGNRVRVAPVVSMDATAIDWRYQGQPPYVSGGHVIPKQWREMLLDPADMPMQAAHLL